MTQNTTPKTSSADAAFVRYAVIALLVILAFFASYRLATASRGPATADAASLATGPAGTPQVGAPNGTTSGSAGGACCGGSGSSTPIEGSAKADTDGVQRITVDTSSGSYDPNVIKLKAGVPAEITFKAATGCLGQVQSADLGFSEDLTTGDKTVKLDGLSAGTYQFSCGMQMVFGQIVVE